MTAIPPIIKKVKEKIIMLTKKQFNSILSSVVLFSALAACGTREQEDSYLSYSHVNQSQGEYLWCGSFAEYGDTIFASDKKKSIISNIRNFSLLEVNGTRYLHTGFPYSKDPVAYPCQVNNNNTLVCEGYGVWVKDHELSTEFDQNKLIHRAYPITVTVDLNTAEQYGNEWKADIRVTAGGHIRPGICQNY